MVNAGIMTACDLFPAWAGVILARGDTAILQAAFPRMGGGDPGASNPRPEPYHFSPHGRG